MKKLDLAMFEEKQHQQDRLNGKSSDLAKRLAQYGYENLQEYFYEKREFLFSQWKPEIYPVAVKTLTTELEQAIQNNQFGIYLSTTDGPYVFHGSDVIDYDLCEELDVTVAEVFYHGGTIVGGPEDLGIAIVAPRTIGLEHNYIITKFFELLNLNSDTATIDGNDILVDGKKVLGSMQRIVGSAYVWAAQISFTDQSELIGKLCNKQSKKVPGYLNANKEEVLRRILGWLRDTCI